jgi:predicted PurR-regulated permease PerM
MTESARFYYISFAMAALVLLGTLYVGLLPALLAGLLIYQIVEFGARVLVGVGFIPSTGKLILLLGVALLFMAVFAVGLNALASQISSGPESFAVLMQRMSDVVMTGQNYLPLWTQQYLPANIEEWQVQAGTWLRENAREFGLFGKEVGIFLAHIVIGSIIGGMIALNPGFQNTAGPLGQAFGERVIFVDIAFRRIVFSQIRISALNTFLTAIFLTVILPALGSPLPLTKIMIAITFIAGLLPIIGNLISNTVIFIIALSVSPIAAMGSLVFLVVLHKLEYFVNAHIIGTQIRAKAWELLIAMLVMESLFGIAGLVAAPIYYAYLKDELTARKLI